MSDIKYEIVKILATFQKPKGWAKELNLISWNDRGRESISANGHRTREDGKRGNLVQGRVYWH